jgi:uncharacterized radical SAM superfamily Fe-S cluster-containing enzyme
VLDAQILIRHNKVYLRKRCSDHRPFEALVYCDAALYTNSSNFNKPGTIPLEFSTAVCDGCPLCFAQAEPGFQLTLEEVEQILDHLVATEGNPEVVQFSRGEPSIHPRIIPMMRAARERGIRNVMLNTNGKRIAKDDRFLESLAEVRPNMYFQFASLACG